MTQLKTPSPQEFGIESKKAAQIQAQFQPMLEKMAALESEYNKIQARAKTAIDEDLIRDAHDLHKKYVKVRTGTAEIHKEQKAFYLAAGRFVDGWKNAQIFAAQGIEAKLKEIITFKERQEAEAKEKLRADRWALLQPFKDEEPAGLGEMEADVFEAYLAMNKHRAQEAEEARQEAERLRVIAEIAKNREIEILPLRNFWPVPLPNLGEMTAEEFAELYKGAKAREKEYIAEQERIAEEAAKARKEAEQERKAREEAEKKAKAEREALQAEAERKRKAAAAKAKKESEAAAEKARQEERQRLEAEQAKLASEAAEKAKQEAALLASMSDKRKLKEMAKSRPEKPELKSEDAQHIAKQYFEMLQRAEVWLKDQIEKRNV